MWKVAFEIRDNSIQASLSYAGPSVRVKRYATARRKCNKIHSNFWGRILNVSLYILWKRDGGPVISPLPQAAKIHFSKHFSLMVYG